MSRRSTRLAPLMGAFLLVTACGKKGGGGGGGDGPEEPKKNADGQGETGLEDPAGQLPTRGTWRTVDRAARPAGTDAWVGWTGKEFVILQGAAKKRAADEVMGWAFDPESDAWRDVMKGSCSVADAVEPDNAALVGGKVVLGVGEKICTLDLATLAWTETTIKNDSGTSSLSWNRYLTTTGDVFLVNDAPVLVWSAATGKVAKDAGVGLPGASDPAYGKRAGFKSFALGNRLARLSSFEGAGGAKAVVLAYKDAKAAPEAAWTATKVLDQALDLSSFSGIRTVGDTVVLPNGSEQLDGKVDRFASGYRIYDAAAGAASDTPAMGVGVIDLDRGASWTYVTGFLGASEQLLVNAASDVRKVKGQDAHVRAAYFIYDRAAQAYFRAPEADHLARGPKAFALGGRYALIWGTQTLDGQKAATADAYLLTID